MQTHGGSATQVLILSSICLWNLHSALGTFISPLGAHRSGKEAVAPFSEHALPDLISLHSHGRRLDKRLSLPDLPALSLPINLRRLRGGKGFEDGVDDGNTNRGDVGKNIFFPPLRGVARDWAEEEPGDGGNTSSARVVDSSTINLNKAEGSPIFPDNKAESESARERESERATATATERNKATVCEIAKGSEADTKQKMERKERRHRQVKTRADKESSFSTESERGGKKTKQKGGSDVRVRHAAPLREGTKGRCEGASRIVVALQLLLHPLRVALVRAWAAANRIHELTHVSGLPGPRALLGLVQRLYHSLRSLLLVIFTTPLGCVSTLLEVMLKLRWVLVPLALQMLMQVRFFYLIFFLFFSETALGSSTSGTPDANAGFAFGVGVSMGHGAVVMRRKAVVISEATSVLVYPCSISILSLYYSRND